MKEVFLTAGLVLNKSWRVLFGREIPTRRLPLMHFVQEQAKRKFGGWMDGWGNSHNLVTISSSSFGQKKKIIRNRRNYLKQKILFTKNLQQRELFYYKDLVQLVPSHYC